MKKWKQAVLAALFCTCTTLTGLAADTAKTAPAEAAVQTQTAETGAEKTAEKASVPTDPLAGHTGKIIDKYYLTKGSTYKDVTTRPSIPSGPGWTQQPGLIISASTKT